MINLSSVASLSNLSSTKSIVPATNTVTNKNNDEVTSTELANMIKKVNEGSSPRSDDLEQGSEITEEDTRVIKNAIDMANEKVKNIGMRQLAFSYSESTKRISIKVYDALTKEVIREIPPEKTIEMLERIYDLAGILVDEKR